MRHRLTRRSAATHLRVHHPGPWRVIIQLFDLPELPGVVRAENVGSSERWTRAVCGGIPTSCSSSTSKLQVTAISFHHFYIPLSHGIARAELSPSPHSARQPITSHHDIPQPGQPQQPRFRLLALTCHNQLFPSVFPTCESSLPALDVPRSIFPWTDAVAPWGWPRDLT